MKTETKEKKKLRLIKSGVNYRIAEYKSEIKRSRKMIKSNGSIDDILYSVKIARLHQGLGVLMYIKNLL